MNRWFEALLSSVGDVVSVRTPISQTDKTDKSLADNLSKSETGMGGTDRTDKSSRIAINPDDSDLDHSFTHFERMQVGIRIESGEHGNLWLISNERCRAVVDTKDPVYLASEARLIVTLKPSELKLLHGFKKLFGGRIDLGSGGDELR